MRTGPLIGLVVATIGLAAGAVTLAAAAQPPRVEGQSCQALAAEIGPSNVWQTTFWGSRVDVFGDAERIFTAPCFASEAECKAWLYWAQSDWEHNSYQWPPCQRSVR